MSRIYNQLSHDEEAALSYNLLYRTHSRKDHPELFGTSVWNNGFYKRLSSGEESLKRKGIIDRHCNPTDLAYQILPTENLKKC